MVAPVLMIAMKEMARGLQLMTLWHSAVRNIISGMEPLVMISAWVSQDRQQPALYLLLPFHLNHVNFTM